MARQAGIFRGTALLQIIVDLGERLFGKLATPPPTLVQPRVERPYLARKRSLPIAFSSSDWDNALDYWGYQCAVCGRPRGLWHTLAQDHWIPLSDSRCPGTVPTNILPLCHGEGGCNNSKGSKDPVRWLEERLGKRRAAQKLAEIQAYFAWVEAQGCSCYMCGSTVQACGSDGWLCSTCGTLISEQQAAQLLRCPECECWLRELPYGYHCPRCERTLQPADMPDLEWCPCGKGILDWHYKDGEGWWQCRKCGSEWENAE
ncbi:MAG: hypothetical protein SNJ58_00420 [Aggregatilineales bacterium]